MKIEVTKWENGQGTICFLNLTQTYYKHGMRYDHDSNTLSWVLSLSEQCPTYETTCWTVKDKFIKYVTLKGA